ncbi:CDP-alcohol phosphatidyltransferase family protein [Litoribacillus peritrichatus]
MSNYSWLPNALTVLRCLLVVPVAWFIHQQNFVAALVTFGVAGFTDGLDGYIARKYHWQSYIGAILDPLADKLLMMVSFISLTFIGLVPFWLMIVVVIRDLVIVAGAALFRWLHGPYMMSPSISGKVSTFLQILLVLWLLVEQALSLEGGPITVLMIWFTLVVAVISGLEYIVVWYRKSTEF